MTQSKRRPPLSPERALQRDLMDALMGFRVRTPRARDVSREAEPAPLEPHDIPKVAIAGPALKPEPIEIEVLGPKLEPAMKLVGPTDKPQEAAAPPVPAHLPTSRQSGPERARMGTAPVVAVRPPDGTPPRSRP